MLLIRLPVITVLLAQVLSAEAQVLERVSVNSAEAQGNAGSFNPAFDATGNIVVFDSFATNLVANDTNDRRDVFARFRFPGTTSRVSLTQTRFASPDPQLVGGTRGSFL